RRRRGEQLGRHARHAAGSGRLPRGDAVLAQDLLRRLHRGDGVGLRGLVDPAVPVVPSAGLAAGATGALRAARATRGVGAMTEIGTEILTVHEVRRGFGGLKAVDGATFKARAAHITGLIGPNGAG